MYERILVALDGSKQAESVLGEAAALAARHNAEVVLLMVLPMPTMVIQEGRLIATVDQEVDRARQLAQPYLTKWKDRFEVTGIRTTTAVRFGDQAEQIADHAREERIDLIVLPSKTPKGLDRLLRRSLAEKVVNIADAPVLTMKAA